MTRSEILKKIRDNLAIAVDDPTLQISEATTSEDVEEWDSVNHMKLIIALESERACAFVVGEDLGIVEPGVREAMIPAFRGLGFKFVTLDLEGFRSGSMNGLISLDSLLRPIASKV